jgi:hypothetical protein
VKRQKSSLRPGGPRRDRRIRRLLLLWLLSGLLIRTAYRIISGDHEGTVKECLTLKDFTLLLVDENPYS